MIALTEKATVRDIDLSGKTVLVRVDYNVPFRPRTVEISDDSRIRASLPTVRYLTERECRVVLCSHLGRPNGAVMEALRLAPVTRRLSELLGKQVTQAADCVGPEVRAAVDSLRAGEVMVLENLRFHPGEESNSAQLASELASLAEVYVDDAFGTAHRAHASTHAVTRFLPAVAGFLMARELEMLGRALESPERPFAAVIGGAKVSDKIAVLESLSARVDTLVIGGGMAAAFLRAQGLQTGGSPVDDAAIESAAGLIRSTEGRGVDLLLPVDVVIADSFAAAAKHRTVEVAEIPPAWQIMDIGPRTVSRFEEALAACKTVVWNGPMGVFEWEPFAQGTVGIARSVAGLDQATTVVGGGSTAEAVESLGLADKMSHVSTGGGASLEFLEGRVLPGVAALMNRETAR